MSLFISGLKLPKKGRYSTVTIYWDGRVVFKFGGAEAGQAVEVSSCENRKKAKWVVNTVNAKETGNFWICPVCGNGETYQRHFCPNCGTDMR